MKEDTLRSEFINHPVLAGANGYCNEMFANKIADWWLTYFRSYREGLIQEVEHKKRHLQGILGDEDYMADMNYNIALDDIITLIQEK